MGRMAGTLGLVFRLEGVPQTSGDFIKTFVKEFLDSGVRMK